MKDNIVWQKRQKMSSKEFEIYFYSDNYPKDIKLHHHDFYEIYYFVKGSVNYVIDGRSYNLENGDILLISPNELHQLFIEPSQPYERYVFWISESFMKNLSTFNTDLFKVYNLHKNLVRLETNESKKIFERLEKIYEKHNSKEFGDDLLIRTEIFKIFIFLYQKLYPTSNLIKNECSLIDEIIEYINSNLASELSVQLIAENFNLSASRISHIFKENTGCSMHQYVLKKRLLHTKELIEQGMPINKIYDVYGFNDYAGFFRAFKKEYGITPKQYYKFMLDKQNK